MRKILLLSNLLACFFAGAQTNITYYDWQWKPCNAGMARFVSTISATDSGFSRSDYFVSTKKLQMKGHYTDSTCKIKNGWFKYFYANGNLSSAGSFVSGKRHGIWTFYHHNGMMRDSLVFDMGSPTGLELGWHPNGSIADSILYTYDEGVVVHWFDNGNPSVAGKTLQHDKHGTWKYFHHNGSLSSQEVYNAGTLVSKIYFDESGKQLADTSNIDRDAEFKGGKEKWQKYLSNNLQWPPGVRLVNTDIITVVVAIILGEEGEIKEAYIDVPFNKLFDDEALRVVKKSPRWIPAVNHNRRVSMFLRQPISFSQGD